MLNMLGSALIMFAVVHPEIWPRLERTKDAKTEKAVDQILAKMTLEEKVGQILQPSVAHVTPADVKKYRFGSVLNGGGGFPGDIRKVTARDWLALSDALHAASPDIPLIWGSDAVHGHSNVIGSTIFPHNIGLGATRNYELIQRVGEVTATEMAVTGIDWDFSPVVAVARDDRWGRTYESYSEDPQIVAAAAAAMVKGLRGKVLATAKHYLGDGGTAEGKDQGDTSASETELRDVHAPGYVSALKEGAETVMISQSSWHGEEMHGHRALLTDVLKGRLGFDGIVVGDWNGHGQVPGCTNKSCPSSLNAGLDMFMVPEDWKALYENTLAQVKSGEVPQARLDDAVRRILRVKMQAGLFERKNPLRGKFEQFGSRAHRDVARQAVRESLVLLKNNGGVLPLRPKSNVLVAGDGAHNIAKQSGGWTISWQGDGNSNSDFPGATSIWDGIRETVHAAGGRATLSPDGTFSEKPDAAIVVFGEDPYAEWFGDLRSIVFRGEKELALLRKFKDADVPVVSVFLAGRPLWVNPHLNASGAFVAAWLPGSEGNGIADVLFTSPDGKVRHDFRGKLSFSWPKLATQVVLNQGQAGYDPLFSLGFGLTYKDRRALPELETGASGVEVPVVFFQAGPIAPWKLQVDPAVGQFEEPAGRRVLTWSGKGGEVSLRAETPPDLKVDANRKYELSIHLLVERPPTRAVMVNGADVAATLRALPVGQWRTIRVPFGSASAPLRITTDGDLVLRLADVELAVARTQLGAGFRYSAYGPPFDPGPEYWALAGFDMARRFERAVPETVWIVSRMNGRGTLLNFPANARDPLIAGSPDDGNEATLDLFDRLGYRVWLQIEPGFASVDELIDLILARYKHHSSVIGFGIDVEWYRSTSPDEGQAVTDAEAAKWLAAVRGHNRGHRLFLKHWEQEKMPPTVREGLMFIDDSQILPSLEAMVEEFEAWGRAFAPAPVGFQYGYPSDRRWWSTLGDPPGDIGAAILARVPNAEGLYWVDFTILDAFPPTVRAAAGPAVKEPRKFQKLALTPPMGWNSWNRFACNVDEALIRATADAMVSSGMREAGYQYVVIDDCWHGERTADGSITADPKRFPSGMKALADYVHSKGLKFGLYSDAGWKTCGGRPGSRGREFQDAKTYASWGVDYLKYDWCNTEGLNAEGAYLTMSEALLAAGRPVVLSICEWGNSEPWLWGKNVGHLWRTTGDITNCFDCVVDHGTWKSWGVMQILDRQAQANLRVHAGPDRWNDPDMLEVGNGMSAAEDRAHLSMWSMLAAPLMAGNDLREMSNETREILTNRDVIAVNQDPLGVQGYRHRVVAGAVEVWARPLASGDWAFTFLNRSNAPFKTSFDWTTPAVADPLSNRKLEGLYAIRDLWSKQSRGDTSAPFVAEIPPHDVVMVRLKEKR
jgi:beta-glucosidase